MRSIATSLRSYDREPVRMKRAISRKNLWEKTPPVLKSTIGLGLGFLPVKWLLGKRFRKNCSFVRNAQWWSAERSGEYQIDRLRQIVKLAYERTPFYRRLFDAVGFQPRDLGSLEDRNRFP